jgi:AAA+ superfamily predicted ATPase
MSTATVAASLPTISVGSLQGQFDHFLKMELFKYLDSGNPFINVLLGTLLAYLFGVAWQAAASLQTKAKRYTDPVLFKAAVFSFVRAIVVRILPKSRLAGYFAESETKVAEVKLITDTKDLNANLYDATFAFCNSLIKSDDLPKVSWQKVENKHGVPTPTAPKDSTCKFHWGGHEVTYQHSSPMVTIYADRERQRENPTIQLSCTVKKGSPNPFGSFFADATAFYTKQQANINWVQTVFRNQGDEWVKTKASAYRKLDTVVLSEGLKEEIEADFKDFATGESWYKEHDLDYECRYLFYGAPRTGKTSMIKALATYAQRHIHYLQLSTVKDDEQLAKLFEKVDAAKTIIVIEDIDASTDAVLDRTLKFALLEQKAKESEKKEDSEKKEESKDKGVTLAGLLNVMDGILKTHGQMLIMTSNHPEKLDPALVDSERIHRKFEFKLASKKQLIDLCQNVIQYKPDLAEVENFVEYAISPAAIVSQFKRHKREPKIAVKMVVEESISVMRGETKESSLRGIRLDPETKKTV